MINRLYLILVIVLGIWILGIGLLSVSFSLVPITGGGPLYQNVWEFIKYNFLFITPKYVGLPALAIGWYFSRNRKHKLIALVVSTFLICALFVIMEAAFYIMAST